MKFISHNTLRIQYCVTPSINAIFGASGEAGISVRVFNSSSVSRCKDVSFFVIICMLGLLFSFHTIIITGKSIFSEEGVSCDLWSSFLCL